MLPTGEQMRLIIGSPVAFNRYQQINTFTSGPNLTKTWAPQLI